MSFCGNSCLSSFVCLLPEVQQWDLTDMQIENLTGQIQERRTGKYRQVCCLKIQFSGLRFFRIAFSDSEFSIKSTLLLSLHSCSCDYSFYSYSKRFTLFCHFILGLGIGISPSGAWIAIQNNLELVPALWSFGLMFHIAGFDILYSSQDVEIDKN